MPLNPTSCTANNGTIKISGSYTQVIHIRFHTQKGTSTLDTTANSMGQLWLINLAECTIFHHRSIDYLLFPVFL